MQGGVVDFQIDPNSIQKLFIARNYCLVYNFWSCIRAASLER